MMRRRRLWHGTYQLKIRGKVRVTYEAAPSEPTTGLETYRSTCAKAS